MDPLRSMLGILLHIHSSFLCPSKRWRGSSFGCCWYLTQNLPLVSLVLVVRMLLPSVVTPHSPEHDAAAQCPPPSLPSRKQRSSIVSTKLPIVRDAPDTFNFLRHVMRANWSVRPKCSHRCVSLKETPLKPVQILKRTTFYPAEQTALRTKWFKHIAI